MIYIEFYTFIIPKQVLEFKFAGGIEEFRQLIPNQSYHEDDQLATARFVRMQDLMHFCNAIEEKGLHYDDIDNYSQDFAVYSFMGFLWQCDWLQTNYYQVWMKHSNN
jgi:hypothetical protein